MSAAPPKSLLYLGIGIRIDPFRKYGNTSAYGTRCPVLAGGFPSATLATFARSLPVPLAYRTPLRGDSHSSLHRPLRGTPRIAPGPWLPA